MQEVINVTVYFYVLLYTQYIPRVQYYIVLYVKYSCHNILCLYNYSGNQYNNNLYQLFAGDSVPIHLHLILYMHCMYFNLIK